MSIWAWVLKAEDLSGRRQTQKFSFGPVLPQFLQERLDRYIPSFRTGALQAGEATANEQRAKRPRIHGLLRLELGPRYKDCLAQGWSTETHSLRSGYYANALDAFVLHVREAWSVAEWEPDIVVAACARKSHGWHARRGTSMPLTTGAMKRMGNAHIFVASKIDLYDGSETLAGSAGADDACLISSLSCQQAGTATFTPCSALLCDQPLVPLPCVRLPSPILALVLAGAWRDLVMLARWSSRVPALHQHLDERWVHSTVNKHAEHHVEPLSLTDAEMVMQCVRKFASSSLEHLVDAEAAEALQARAVTCITALQAHCNAVAPAAVHQKHILPDTFVSQILCSLDLRNRDHLRAHARKFMLCLPVAYRQFLQPWLENHLVSSSSLQRGRVYLDLAIALLNRRRSEKKHGALRYVWVDASLKGGFEVFNARVKILPADQARGTTSWSCTRQARTWTQRLPLKEPSSLSSSLITFMSTRIFHNVLAKAEQAFWIRCQHSSIQC